MTTSPNYGTATPLFDYIEPDEFDKRFDFAVFDDDLYPDIDISDLRDPAIWASVQVAIAEGRMLSIVDTECRTHPDGCFDDTDEQNRVDDEWCEDTAYASGWMKVNAYRRIILPSPVYNPETGAFLA